MESVRDGEIERGAAAILSIALSPYLSISSHATAQGQKAGASLPLIEKAGEPPARPPLDGSG